MFVPYWQITWHRIQEDRNFQIELDFVREFHVPFIFSSTLSSFIFSSSSFLSCRIWGSHSGCYENFWTITSCIPLKVYRRFGGACRLHLQGRRINQARNLRGSRWVETSVEFQRTTRPYIPEDRTHPFTLAFPPQSLSQSFLLFFPFSAIFLLVS
jgi:hypothetical protein